MNRAELFQEALVMSQEKYMNNPDYIVLKAIITQLEYLIGVINGEEHDLSKLKTIIIGRMTVYDIDEWDRELADILYLVAEEAKKMILEYRC